NPAYVEGPLGKYYLDQTTSSAVDAGSGIADAVNYPRTSDPTDPISGTDPVIDGEFNDPVDMGYRYMIPNPDSDRFLLQTSVLYEDETWCGHGSVTPADEYYYVGKVVDLTADIDEDHYLTGWAGSTANDNSREFTNKVVMLDDTTVSAIVRLRQTFLVGGTGEYLDVQAAIDDAQDGDMVMIYPGTYAPAVGAGAGGTYYTGLVQISLNGKALQISGTNPDDPAVVRATVLDSYQFSLIDAPEEAVVEGITLTSGDMEIYGGSPTIRNCVFYQNNWSGGTLSWVLECPGKMDGGDGGSVLGGAVTIQDAAPKFINCTFEENSATGGTAQNGENGCDVHLSGGDGGWPGRAYGGAVYAGFSSQPVFESCVFLNNQANGGVGGNGGEGAEGAHGGRGGGFLFPDSYEDDPMLWFWWDGWEDGDKYYRYSQFYDKYDWETWAEWFSWDNEDWTSWEDFFLSDEYTNYYYGVPAKDKYEEYWRYSGYGGAVFCAYDTKATFNNCVFQNNMTSGGLSGIGGIWAPTPNRQIDIPTAGGAVYAAFDSTLNFDNCVFSGNVSDKTTEAAPYAYEVSFGGAVAYEFGCTATFTDCDIEQNDAAVGGGIYGRESVSMVADCNIRDNEAYIGAGIYFDEEVAIVTDTILRENKAKLPDQVVEDPDDEEPPADDDDVIIIPTATLDMTGKGAGMAAHMSDLDVVDTVFVDNSANLSGGGLYLIGTVNEQSDIFNCLFVGNRAGRDGGGASVNWQGRGLFDNCTFADNTISSLETTGGGGGLYTAYHSIVDVVDSIFWGNDALKGTNIMVGSGFEFDPRPSSLHITYSDVESLDSANSIFVGPGCGFDDESGLGMIDSDPDFKKLSGAPAEETWHSYYLNQDSGAVDSGSDLSGNKKSGAGLTSALDFYTTSVTGARDQGDVDMGYHYDVVYKSNCALIDSYFEFDGIIDLADLVLFLGTGMDHDGWLDPGCSPANGWCSGSDINTDGYVNLDDMASVSLPNALYPSEGQVSFTSVMMEIAETHDNWVPDSMLEYQFRCVTEPMLSPSDSASEGDNPRQGEIWVPYTTAFFNGLEPGKGYEFEVRARDSRLNETEFSAQLEDIVKPGDRNMSPDPAEWYFDPV
ncbi:MAG: right-handed parallel beta-helix repeat-containing protein, partial [Planctomycetota bacterium]